MIDDVVVIEAPESISSYFDEFGIHHEQISKRAIDGDMSTYAYVIAGASLVVPKLLQLLQEVVKARKNVKVSYKGVTIQGVSEDALPKLIELLKSHSKK